MGVRHFCINTECGKEGRETGVCAHCGQRTVFSEEEIEGFSSSLSGGKDEAPAPDAYARETMRWMVAAGTAERLLGDSEGICVVDEWLTEDEPTARFFMVRQQGLTRELVRRVWGRELQLSLSKKQFESLVGLLKKVLFELEDHPDPNTLLDGNHIGVFMNWHEERLAHQVFCPEGPGNDVIDRIMNASRLRLRLMCLMGDW